MFLTTSKFNLGLRPSISILVAKRCGGPNADWSAPSIMMELCLSGSRIGLTYFYVEFFLLRNCVNVTALLIFQNIQSSHVSSTQRIFLSLPKLITSSSNSEAVILSYLDAIAVLFPCLKNNSPFSGRRVKPNFLCASKKDSSIHYYWKTIDYFSFCPAFFHFCFQLVVQWRKLLFPARLTLVKEIFCGSSLLWMYVQ